MAVDESNDVVSKPPSFSEEQLEYIEEMKIEFALEGVESLLFNPIGMITLLLAALGLLNLGFSIISEHELLFAVFKSPIQPLSYLILAVVSLVGTIEVRKIIHRDPRESIKRYYRKAMLSALMIVALLFYLHIELEIHPVESTWISWLGGLTGVVVGWFLPSWISMHKYGGLTQMFVFVIVVGLSWLARVESIQSYAWLGFAVFSVYLFRSAVDGIGLAEEKKAKLEDIP